MDEGPDKRAAQARIVEEMLDDPALAKVARKFALTGAQSVLAILQALNL